MKTFNKSLGYYLVATLVATGLTGCSISPPEFDLKALPPPGAGGIPPEVRERLTERFAMEGTIEVVIIDNDDGTASRKHFLKNSDSRLPLRIYNSQRELRTGDRVAVNGWIFGEQHSTEIVIEGDNNILILGATGGDNSGEVGALPYTLGDRSVAVVLVNFQDAPQDKPWTRSQINDTVFGTVNDFIQEASYNQTWLTGAVFDWITLPVDGATSCPANYHYLADQALIDAGINLDNYTHMIYNIPPSSACAVNAGTLGSDGKTRAWISAALDARIVAHEFGHNLGLSHAHSLNCQGDVLATNCTTGTYGDLWDIMGTNMGHMNAFNKDLLGWIGINQAPPIATVISTGIHTISPFETDTYENKAIKIPAGTDPITGRQVWYYLEYRQPLGFDAGLFEPGYMRFPEALQSGVVVHRAIDAQRNSSFLLDMTPDSITSFAAYDMRDAALVVGETYTDPELGISITPLSSSANGISVSTVLDETVSPMPLNSAPVAKNDSATVVSGSSTLIDVLSNDTDADGDPLALTSASSQQAMVSISGSLLLYAPEASFSGTDLLNYTISDGQGGSASAQVSVTVLAGNNPPIAVDDTASTLANSSVSISVLANDYDPDDDSLSLTGTSNVSGNVSTSGTSLIFTPVTGFTGSTEFNYSISDNRGGAASARVTIQVNPAVNLAPVATDDLATMASIAPIDIFVLANDSDPEGDAIYIIDFTQGSAGDVSLNGSSLTYSPARKFKTNDSFTYTITDGQSIATARVTISLDSKGTDGTDSGTTNKGGGGKGGKR